MHTTKKDTPRHTCDAPSGSERSENTCAACHDEMKAARTRYPCPDYMAMWLEQVRR